MRYRILLLDADGTLLDFLKAEAHGIEAALKKNHLPFRPDILQLYSDINRSCWEEFERGALSKEVLLVERFRRLFGKLGVEGDPATVALSYRDELGRGAYLIDGARELLDELKETHDLYIITNGVAETQYSRFSLSGLDKLVKKSFISEEIGFPKPQKEFFDYVFAHIPDFQKEETLIVGDSLTADIQGGINAGVDTCWYNPAHLPNLQGREITYEIDRICDLKNIVS